jgi:hypothetical protein
MGEKFKLRPWEIDRLTDRQIIELYCRQTGQAENEVPEPQTEDDVRAWCASVAATFQMDPDEYEQWVIRAVAAWHAEREASGEGQG